MAVGSSGVGGYHKYHMMVQTTPLVSSLSIAVTMVSSLRSRCFYLSFDSFLTILLVYGIITKFSNCMK